MGSKFSRSLVGYALLIHTHCLILQAVYTWTQLPPRKQKRNTNRLLFFAAEFESWAGMYLPLRAHATLLSRRLECPVQVIIG